MILAITMFSIPFLVAILALLSIVFDSLKLINIGIMLFTIWLLLILIIGIYAIATYGG
jgi:hypothetical protein